MTGDRHRKHNGGWPGGALPEEKREFRRTLRHDAKLEDAQLAKQGLQDWAETLRSIDNE